MNAYDLHHYGKKIETIFTKYEQQLQKKFPNSEIPLEIFIDADPSSNKIYLEWIVDSFVNDGIARVEDIESRLKPALEDYIYLKESGQLEHGKNSWENEKDINNYCGLIGCKKKKFQKIGLEKLLDRYKIILEHRREKVEQTDQIKRDTKLIFENNDFTILSPTTKEASCYYGQGTKWCTAATKGQNMFDEYAKSGDIYIMIPKNPRYVGEKYQFHFEEEQFMNEQDENVFLLTGTEAEIFKPLLTIYPSLNNWDKVKNFHYINLNLSNSNLDELPELPEGLQILDCSLNNLKFLPNLPETLKVLDCSDNQLIDISILPIGLKELNCAENSIALFPINISECTELETLIMNNNQIMSIPNNLPDSIKTIIIFDNDLKEIPNTLPASLKELNVENNPNLIPSEHINPQLRIYY